MTNSKRTAALKANSVTRTHNLPKTLEASIAYAAECAIEATTTRDRSNTLMLDMGREYAHGVSAFNGGKETEELANRYMVACFPNTPQKIGDKANNVFSEKRSKLRLFGHAAVIAAAPDYDVISKLPGEKWINCYNVHKAIRDAADKAKAAGGKDAAPKAAPVKVTADLIAAATTRAKPLTKAEREAKAAKEAKDARAKMTPADKANEAVTLLRNAFAALGNGKVRTLAIGELELSKPMASALEKLIDAITA